MVIDAVRQSIELTPSLIQQWADRHTGVGFDQLLIAAPPRNKNADFFYRIFNADGSEAAQCGNGARCLARFLHEEKLTEKNPIVVETLAGLLTLTLGENEQVTVDMGAPVFAPEKIPLLAEKPALTYSLKIDQQDITFCALSMGNPHAVIFVEDIAKAPVQTLGAQLTNHPLFPERANIGFMQIVQRDFIHLRVYERGSGETLACGSGACAAVAAGNLLGKLASSVTVQQPGGRVHVTWNGTDKPVYLTGPAIKVFQGII